MRLAVDIRTNHQAGIYRFAKELIGPLLRQAAAYDIKVGVIYDGVQDDLVAALAGTIADATALTFRAPAERYVRNSAPLRTWLAEQAFDVYFAVSYMFDAEIDIPVAFVLHDVIPLMAGYELSDANAAESYGPAALQAVRAALPGTINSERSFAAFARYELPRLAERARLVITVSEASRELIERHLPAARDKVCVVRNSVDETLFAAAPELVPCDEGAPTILFVGLDKPHKRIGDLVDAFEQACRAGAKGVLRLISPQPPTLNTLTRISAARAHARIILETGVSDRTLAARYRQAAAVCCPSAIEGFGLVALEAAACGRPVIASDIAAHRETLGDSAAYFAVGDVAALARLIRTGLAGGLPCAVPLDAEHGWSTAATSILAQLRALSSTDSYEVMLNAGLAQP